MVARNLARDFKQKDLWQALLRGCPKWIKSLTVIFFVYAMVNFAIFFLTTFKQPPRSGSGEIPPSVVRGFSGHWMAFYSASFAIMYSALKVEEFDRNRRCTSGHIVSPLAQFCEECGQPVAQG